MNACFWTLGVRATKRSCIFILSCHVPGCRYTSLVHHGQVENLDDIAKYIAGLTSEDQVGRQSRSIDLNVCGVVRNLDMRLALLRLLPPRGDLRGGAKRRDKCGHYPQQTYRRGAGSVVGKTVGYNVRVPRLKCPQFILDAREYFV